MDLTSLTITETIELLASGKATALDVTNAYLDRIDQLNPTLNAYLTIFHDEARETAKASDIRRRNGELLSQLDGIPLALKDNLSTKGQRTTAASKILDSYQPLYDATVVRKLKAAGIVILGKTNLDEFAMGSSTENSAYGPSKNPWDTSRVPGGSSGGSAVAVAADLCAGALGSDTGGSIRQPASLSGIVGLKPTYGMVSRYGLLAMASSLDQIGPMTKSIADAALLLEIISGHDPLDATTLPSSSSTGSLQAKQDRGSVEAEYQRPIPAGVYPGLRSGAGMTKDARGKLDHLTIGIPKEYFGEGMDKEVRSVVLSAIDELKTLGATIKEVSLPSSHLALAAYYVICPVEVASNMARYDGIRYGESVEREAGDSNLLEVYKKSRSQFLGSEVKRRIMLGTYTSSAGYYDAYYNQAMKVRALIKKEFEAVFREVNILATPVNPTVAFNIGEKIEDPLAMYLGDINTVPINQAGVPALSIPCGFVTDDGKKLPVGLQLIGPHLSEATLLSTARAYEQATSWHKEKPQLRGE